MVEYCSMSFVIWFNMDEDISIINSNTRVEKIKKLFLNNKKKLLILLIIIIMTMISFFGYGEFKKSQKTEISDLYYYTIIMDIYNGINKTSQEVYDSYNSLMFSPDSRVFNKMTKRIELYLKVKGS